VNTNATLMQDARESLNGKWTSAIGTYVLYVIVSSALSPVAPIASGPLQLGSSIFSLNLASGKKAEYSQILDGFKNFAQSLVAFLLVSIFTFLWMLLFIIPGIVASLAYSQTFYIMAENENIKAGEAIKKSKAMMQGHKWQLFCLGWRFFGWFILAMLTLGIGLLWLIPYVQVSLANFYKTLNKHV